MSLTVSEGFHILAVAWPLLVATLLMLPGMRSVGRALTPWAALPALVLSAFPVDTLRLPAVMLGAGLELDATGRIFLFLIASLWLTSGILARDRLRFASSNLFATMLLLAMSGSISLVLSDNALLFFAASTMAGYSLYGALVHESDTEARKACGVLVVLLVLSDLLVFEVLLLLGQAAGATDFGSLRQAFVNIDSKNLVLGLLIIGFGIRFGMLGVHFWIPPVFARASAELRPALMAFMLGAGVLGGLRLLPLGQLDASEVAITLQWLSWLTLAYAGFAGMAQVLPRSIIGYAAVVLGGIWLIVLSACLQQPALWRSLAYPSAVVLIQSGTGLTALLLIDRINGLVFFLSLPRLVSALAWLALLLLAMAPLGLVSAVAGQVSAISIWSAMAVIALLAGNTLFHWNPDPLAEPPERYPPSAAVPASHPVKAPFISLWVVAALIMISMLAAGYQFLHVPPGEAVTGLFIVVAALSTAVLNAKWRVLRLPALEPGDILISISQGLVLARDRTDRVLVRSAQRWIDIAQALDRRVRPIKMGSYNTGFLESILLRWIPALSLWLLLGLLVAWLAAAL